MEVKPCDAQPMVDWTPPEPDLQLEGSHLGRGTKYYDPEVSNELRARCFALLIQLFKEICNSFSFSINF